MGVDAAGIRTSNWLRFVNCPRYKQEENVIPCICRGKVYYMTISEVYPGTELLVFYGADYAQQLGINVTRFTR